MTTERETAAKTEKQHAIEVIDALPDGASTDDVLYALDVRRVELRGLPDPERDEGLSREQRVERLRRRLMLTGAP